jgi:signal transduction histidine kinase
LIFYQTDALTALVIFAFTTLLVLELASVALRTVKAKALVAFFMQLAVFAIAGFSSTFALNLAELDAGLYPVARIVALTLVIGLAMFIGQVRQTQRYASQEKAREVNEQLELLNSQARRELWLNRRRIATVLHGPVQAALYASAMRLAQSKRPTKKLIQSVNQDLESALEVLKFERASSVNLRDVLQQISEVWAGTCEIYFNVSKPAFHATKKDANLSEAAIELIREAVSNAIKHGSASEVDIDVRLGDSLLEISVTNNGKAAVNRAGTGFGSKLYSELSHSWQLTKLADDRTRFSATVASV